MEGNQKNLSFTSKVMKVFLFLLICVLTLIFRPQNTFAIDNANGEIIFTKNCSGCHVNGGNIIRRSKNLKIKNLKRKNIDNPDAIAKIARKGIGIMDGYEDVLKEDEDQIVAIWILQQAQKAWTQG